ncbi:response regulator [Halonotius terrestris]|uniref:histidine kinase n=1 Tax=Halonotius terrestris TaxID=2487750 RepID=A0A8J8PB10_9EURY|nr:response regulator [Halonotius terrestris]TQQ79781.1 response regulator [Halonotius terrestris]
MTDFSSNTPKESIHVLHVDDEPDLARMVTENLEAETDRFTVEWTTDPAEVADIVADRTVDCVISDYMMPDMTGLDVLSEVRSVDPDLPFILFTDTGSESVASEAISAGVSDYIIKRRVKEQYTLLANKVANHVDQRRAEIAAERTKQQLHELAENTHDVLFIFSADWTKLEYINSRYEEMFDQSVATLREDPTSFLGAVHPDDVADVKGAMQRSGEGHTQEVTYRIQGDDDEWKWVESHAEPIFEDGAVVRVAGFTHNMTERKQRELELRAKNERLERFASIVSHDLRNPLSVADGYLEMARNEADSDHLETVASALDRMETLISEILVLAREGQEVTETESVVLDTIVQSSWSNIDQQAARLQADTNVYIEADKIRLGQVFENLFRNAIEHGGDDVTITVGVLDDDAGFYVENDGDPIPDGKKNQIFETGFTTNKQGTGFGLAIIKRIVTAHGWDIRATDGADGGARFEITGVEVTPQEQPPEQN